MKRDNVNGTVIEVTDFRKAYSDVVAVDGISFEVRKGEIFGGELAVRIAVTP